MSDHATIRLRRLAEADVDHVMTWVNDPAVVGNLAAFAGTPMTRAQELAWIQSTLRSPTDVVFSVFAADDERYLGQIGLHQIHARSKVARIGVVIAAKTEMGRGYGTAAIRALLDHAFGPGPDSVGLHKVWLMIFAHNTRSRGIYERIGFVQEGLLRDEYFHDGAWHDMARMSILAREWAKLKG